MVAKISHGSNLYGALAYNQEKVDGGLGKVLATNLVIEPADGKFNAYSCMEDFQRFMPSHVRTSKPIVHISLNPHPDDKLSDAQLSDIGREYLQRLGYGEQPFMIFKHEDIDRQHIHLVTTRVKPDGSLVPDKFEKDRSHKIVQQLEKEFNLIPAKGQKQGEAWKLTPVDASAGNLKKQVANVIKPLASMYKFQSLSEFRALLSLYNIGVEKVEGENKGNRYTGLVYSALDKDGNRVGKPLKSSLFGKPFGIDRLEQTMKKSNGTIKGEGRAAKTKALVSASLADSCTGSEFRANLQGKGIDLVLRHNDQGRLFGVTYIDHNSRTVFNGSALGKEFSANAIAGRFADFSQTSREDLQPHSPATQMGPDTSRKPSAIVQNAHTQSDRSGDPPGSSLLSVLTPETGYPDDNQPMPKPRKKKKRRYGRQV